MDSDSHETPETVLGKWNKGLLSRSEFYLSLLASFTEENVGRSIRSLPVEVREEMKREVENAPTTDEEWARFFIIRPGTFVEGKGLEDWIREQDRRCIRRYRRGVETLRALLSSTDKQSFPEPT